MQGFDVILPPRSSLRTTEWLTYQGSHHEVIVEADIVQHSPASENASTYDKERDGDEGYICHNNWHGRSSYPIERHIE